MSKRRRSSSILDDDDSDDDSLPEQSPVPTGVRKKKKLDPVGCNDILIELILLKNY